MRLLITGARGQLGSELALAAPAGGMSAVAVDVDECDIRDRDAVARALDANLIECVVNCAAWTDVEGAESHRDEAFAINADGALALAEECARRSLLLVHLSTDYVFDGSGGEPIAEDATPCPQSVYGASKLAGEDAVRGSGVRYQIVRTSGLYGRDGPNFILKVLRRAAERNELRVVDDQVTSPTWTAHLSAALLRLIERGAEGTYHLANSGGASWYRIASAAVNLAGLRADIRPISAAELDSPAKRPAFSVLENRAWLRLGEPPLPAWSEGVAGYVEELRVRGRLPSAAPAPR